MYKRYFSTLLNNTMQRGKPVQARGGMKRPTNHKNGNRVHDKQAEKIENHFFHVDAPMVDIGANLTVGFYLFFFHTSKD